MSAKEFAIQLRALIEQIKAGGTAAIYCDNLIRYLDDVINSPSPVLSEAELENYKARLNVWVEENKRAHAASLEMFRSVITAGQNAIRSSFLLNGGAAVAILAFISHLADNQPDKVAAFTGSLIPFVIGVLLTTINSGVTYLSQWFYGAETPGWKYKTGFSLNIFAIALGLASYVVFVWGMCRAYDGFQSF